MKTYLVFEPEASAQDTPARVAFVREKFSWPALFFAPLWLLMNRLWLAFVIFSAVEILIACSLYYLGLRGPVAAAALLLPPLIVAFEAAQLKSFRLLRQGYREVDTVFADNLESAERRYFERRKITPMRQDASLSASPSFSETRLSRPVIGLFPERGR